MIFIRVKNAGFVYLHHLGNITMTYYYILHNFIDIQVYQTQTLSEDSLDILYVFLHSFNILYTHTESVRMYNSGQIFNQTLFYIRQTTNINFREF